VRDLDEDRLERSRIINADASLRRSFPLRLAKSLREMASTLARRDGVSLNYFISHAVAEKINQEGHGVDTGNPLPSLGLLWAGHSRMLPRYRILEKTFYPLASKLWFRYG